MDFTEQATSRAIAAMMQRQIVSYARGINCITLI